MSAHLSAAAVPADAPAPTENAVGVAERQLLAAIERVVRQPLGWVALVLHLSRLLPPAPRPHHRRVARAAMQDVARRQDGSVFVLRNGDVVVLCHVKPDSPPPATVAARLTKLFQRDAPDGTTLVSVWPMTRDAGPLMAYAIARTGESVPAAPAEDLPAPPSRLVDAVAGAIAGQRSQELVQRQTAVLLGSAGGLGADSLRPLYQELTFSFGLLDTRIGSNGQILRDPALVQHVASQLDRRMIELLTDGAQRGGPLNPLAPAPTLHLNLTATMLLSDAFADFAALCTGGDRALGAEISLLDAVADPRGFRRARDRAAELNVTLVLDGVSHLALLLTCPWLLRAGLLKLDWSQLLPDLPAVETARLAEALRHADPARIILHRADSEAAIRWGLAHGIRRFQGRHVDHMLAAARIIGCRVSSECTLKQCVDRAGVPAGPGRAGCRNHRLLDYGMPAGAAR